MLPLLLAVHFGGQRVSLLHALGRTVEFAAAVEDLILADLADLTEDEAERLLAEERP